MNPDGQKQVMVDFSVLIYCTTNLVRLLYHITSNISFITIYQSILNKTQLPVKNPKTLVESNNLSPCLYIHTEIEISRVVAFNMNEKT